MLAGPVMAPLIFYNSIRQKMDFPSIYTPNYTAYREVLFWYYITPKSNTVMYIDGLVQDCSNSIANALELLQYCIKASLSCQINTIEVVNDRDLFCEFLDYMIWFVQLWWCMAWTRFPHYWTYNRETHQGPLHHLSQGSEMQSLLLVWTSCRTNNWIAWFVTSWRSCYLTVIACKLYWPNDLWEWHICGR